MDRVDDQAGQPGIRETLAEDFSRREIVLLVRYCVATLALEQLRFYFLAKWLVLVPAIGLVVFVDSPLAWFAAAILFVVFVGLVLGQRLVRAALARVGAFRRLRAFDDIVTELRTNFRDEVERVSGAAKPHRIVVGAIRLSRGGQKGDDFVEEYFNLDWGRVLQVPRVAEARRALAEAAGNS